MYIGLWLLSAGHVSILLHPHCTPGPSPYIYKRKVQGPRTRRVVARDSLSPSRTLVTPYCKRIHSSAGQHEAAVFPSLCSVSRQPIWAGARSDNLLVGPGTPRGRNADTHRRRASVATSHFTLSPSPLFLPRRRLGFWGGTTASAARGSRGGVDLYSARVAVKTGDHN
jgi:hypothetical protein